jgi:uncharacterized protein with von Willebrand factor type A (vWA) domain
MQSTATDPRQQLADFAHYLREHGFALGFAEINLMLRAASALPLAQWKRTEALWRAIASGSQAQWAKYPELHLAFWFPHKVRGTTRTSGLQHKPRNLQQLVQQMHQDMAQQAGNTPPGQQQNSLGQADDAAAGDSATESESPRAQAGASRNAAPDERDFADWLPGDLDRFEPLVRALKRRMHTQLTRRRAHDLHAGTVHLRRSMRAALASGGELIALHRTQPRRRTPRVAVLVDVSRSMEVHAQFFLRLSRAFVEVLQARAFVFHTRLAEVTPLMKQRSDRVQEKINAVTFGFGGGTRIASCLQDAVEVHMGRWLRRGDVFLVFSDGYDTDPPEALGQLLARLHARGVRVCWLHPTKALPQSEAMQGALPFLHRTMPAHNLASLARLPELLRSTLFSKPTHEA